MCSKKGTFEYNQVINIMHGIDNNNNSNGINNNKNSNGINNNDSSKEELLIMTKNITSYVTHSDRFQSQYERNWNN